MDWHSDFDAVQHRGRGSIGKSVPNQARCRSVLTAVVEVPTSCVAEFAVVHSLGREHLGVDGTVWHSEFSVLVREWSIRRARQLTSCGQKWQRRPLVCWQLVALRVHKPR